VSSDEFEDEQFFRRAYGTQVLPFCRYPPVNWRAIVRGPFGTRRSGAASLRNFSRQFAIAIHELRFEFWIAAFGVVFVDAGVDG
jgi:hypothetical protein